MGTRLLLDEMFSDAIAERLRAKDHDVRSVVADQELLSLPDEAILARATEEGRAVVTANVKDFMPLAAQLEARSGTPGSSHAGLILVSAKTFPQTLRFTAAITDALAALLDEPPAIVSGHVMFLRRR
jgi:hypothetical protein